MKKISSAYILVFVITALYSQTKERKFHFNYFGHVEYRMEEIGENRNTFFSLGEQDFFITADITKKISFLGESVIRFDGKSATSFLPSIERAQVKFDYYKNHSVLVGKMHGPVNYWNDVYHHGRIFFPTIERPIAFSAIVPLHTLGLRFMGQNLGKINFGYDFVLGNGIASTDFFDIGTSKSITASVHIKPVDNLRIQASYYNDFLEQNVAGAHSGHTSNIHINAFSKYTGALNFEMYCFSLAYFGKRFELLNEFVFNITQTDTLGRANNFSNYLYGGYRIKEKHVPYLMTDLLTISNNDLHVSPFNAIRFCVGYRYEISHLINLKFQAERYSNLMHNHDMNHQNHLQTRYDFKVQLSYGF